MLARVSGSLRAGAPAGLQLSPSFSAHRRHLLHALAAKSAFICDMDGVVYRGNSLIPGVKDVLDFFSREGKRFVFLTNSSERSPRELEQKLARLGVDVPASHFHTSAIATAGFLASQRPGGSVYCIGEAGLFNALYEAGLTMNDVNPDYVVVGETHSYGWEKLEKAVRLVLNGARLIGTNPDLTGPTEHGIVPATGSLTAPIELSTGRKAYFVGKPNPLIMRHAMLKLGSKPEDTVIIGDNISTDILSGIEAGIDTALVLSGVTARGDLERYAYRPHHILNSIADLVK